MSATQRQSKKTILHLLRTKEPAEVLVELAGYPPASLLNALFSGICHAEEKTKWNGVTAMGATVARLADQDMEAARIVIRRFMWSLNDESGGIGWGIPEAMAESLACHAALAEEYTHILISFMREDGFYLEHPPLQQGLMWGVERLALVRPNLLRQKNAPRYLLPYLDSSDPVVRGLAARALGLLQEEKAVPGLKSLLGDGAEIRLFQGQRIQRVTAGFLAHEALRNIAGTNFPGPPGQASPGKKI